MDARRQIQARSTSSTEVSQRPKIVFKQRMQSSSSEDKKALGAVAIQQSLHSRSPSSCRSISPHQSTELVCSNPSTTTTSLVTSAEIISETILSSTSIAESPTAGKNNTWTSWTHALIPIRLVPSRPKINTVVPAPNSKGRILPIQKPEVKVEVEEITWERIPAPSGSVRHSERVFEPMSSFSRTTIFQTYFSNEQSRPASSMSQATRSSDHGSMRSRPSTSMSCESSGSNASEKSHASGKSGIFSLFHDSETPSPSPSRRHSPPHKLHSRSSDSERAMPSRGRLNSFGVKNGARLF